MTPRFGMNRHSIRDDRTTRRLRVLQSALIAVAATFAACGGNGPTGPSSSAPFTQTFSGQLPGSSVATHSVNVPRAGTATFTVSGVTAGLAPTLQVWGSSGMIGQGSCPAGQGLCGQFTVTFPLQAGTLELRLYGSGGRLDSTTYSLTVTVR